MRVAKGSIRCQLLQLRNRLKVGYIRFKYAVSPVAEGWGGDSGGETTFDLRRRQLPHLYRYICVSACETGFGGSTGETGQGSLACELVGSTGDIRPVSSAAETGPVGSAGETGPGGSVGETGPSAVVQMLRLGPVGQLERPGPASRFVKPDTGGW